VKQSHKTLLLWVLLIVMFLAIWQFLSPTDRKQPVAFSEFVEEVQKGHVKDIRIKDREYTFTVHNADGAKTTIQREAVGPVPDEALSRRSSPPPT
jgi:cell division protease FtsH